MNTDEQDIKTTEYRMKHFDTGQPRVAWEQNNRAKEASYISVIGYIPSDHISQREWEAMLHRNEMSIGTYTGEHKHPRA
jgi:hypothetical protein